MPRRAAPIDSKAMPAVLAYLTRAVERRSDVFTAKPAEASLQLVALNKALETTPDKDVKQVFNDWLRENVTPQGRVRMLSTLRRKRSDLSKAGSKRRSLTLSPETMLELEALAKEVGGLPVTKLLAAFVAIGRNDKELRDKLLFLAVAYMTAYTLLHKIRESVMLGANEAPMEGEVQMDGAHLSGKIRKPRVKKAATKTQARDKLPHSAFPKHPNRRIVMVIRQSSPEKGQGRCALHRRHRPGRKRRSHWQIGQEIHQGRRDGHDR